jgi:hypothetical protein
MIECPIETSFDAAGENLHRRELYSLNAFAEREPQTSLLRAVFNHWNALRPGGALPRADEFLSGKVTPLGIQGNTTVIDVSDPNPWNFQIESHISNSIAGLGKELEDTLVSNFPCDMSARALMSEYFMTREYRQPFYHEIDQVIFGYARNYTRLMLPLVDERGRVSKLVIASRLIEPAHRIAPAG